MSSSGDEDNYLAIAAQEAEHKRDNGNKKQRLRAFLKEGKGRLMDHIDSKNNRGINGLVSCKSLKPLLLQRHARISVCASAYRQPTEDKQNLVWLYVPKALAFLEIFLE